MYFENNTILYPHSMIRAPVVCGFTTRELGDMTKKEIRDAFFKTIGFKPNNVYWQHQTHGKSVTIATGHESNMIESDATILPYSTHSVGKVLTVHTADCVPMLLWDHKTKMIGVIHSGWRGTLDGIFNQTIQAMARQGSSIDAIHVIIGPHIRPCCYNVDVHRIEAFSYRFGPTSLGVTTEGKTSIDLLNAIVSDVLAVGISGHAIDISCVSCTQCHQEKFFSYRHDKGALTGEILGYIGYNGDNHESRF